MKRFLTLLALYFILFTIHSSLFTSSAQTVKPCGTSVLRHKRAGAVCATRALQNEPSPLRFIGEKRGLVILVSFPNQQFKDENALQVWRDIITLQGYCENGAPGSVSDYFRDQSYGQFRITFDVVGPVEVSQPYEYYGKNKLWSEGDEFDQNDGEMIVEACTLVQDSVNFADYDWDGDGEVEEVFVLYAGHGENDYWYKSEDVIWPHMGTLSVDWADAYPDALTLQGMRIDTYACSNEVTASGLLAGLGTICHEFSHCLGLPDLYNTIEGYTVLGYYDLMDQGSYNGNSWCPVGYSSYERYACGWLEPIQVGSLAEVVELLPLHESPDARLLYLSPDANDYYLIENRQKYAWDTYIPSAGLLAWYIDYDEQAWAENTVNNDADHLRVEHMPVADIPADINRLTLSGAEPVAYYDLKGRRLSSKPSKPGLYIAVLTAKQVVLVSLR